ncbi:MAG: ABC transporter permease [Acholeplasmataceae bacterium]|nr:ABC transporter permease [Acholeplasmataceae bacterium]
MDNKHLDKSQFEFVEIDEKIFDTKFEGKPRSFLKDAMSRFTKNKVNVVATTIVLMVIMLSIFVPILTPKDFTSANSANTKFLPPRIPLLEKLGIFDGSIEVMNYEADLSIYDLIDPALGDVDGNRLYYPKFDLYNTFSPEFVKKGTLTNEVLYGGNKLEAYVGGTNDIILRKFTDHLVGYTENQGYLNATITVDVNSISENTYLDVMIRPSNLETLLPEGVTPLDPASLEYYVQVGKIEDAGVHEFTNTIGVVGALIFVYHAEETDKRLSLNSVDIDFSAATDMSFSGYDLSQWSSISMDGYGGSWVRDNAAYTVASFTYFKYNDIFANREGTLSNEEYDALLAADPEMAASIVLNDPNDPSQGWTFGDGEFQLVNVVSISNPQTGPDGEEYFSYRVTYNGLIAAGYEELPYFIFGTDGKGRDLFAEIWLSLRTSLLLGLIVSAINIFIGVIWGSISGYFGGAVDFGMERFVEVLSSFPGLTVLTILYLKFGAGFVLLLIYLTYSGWVGVARLTRVQFYRYRGREYVLASRTLGAGHMRLIFKHILPNGIGYIITSVVLSVPAMIITEAALSFLGFGLGEGAVLDFGIFKLSGLSLGILLYAGEQNMTAPGRFYLVMIPAIIIIIIMIAFNLFGNALRDAMNPSLRGQE